MKVEDGSTWRKACTSDTLFNTKAVEEYTRFQFNDIRK
jgi:hypothetical protein